MALAGKGLNDGMVAMDVDRVLGLGSGVLRGLLFPGVSVKKEKGGIKKAVGVFAFRSASLT